VARDFRNDSMKGDPAPEVYVPVSQVPGSNLTLILRTRDIVRVATAVRAVTDDIAGGRRVRQVLPVAEVIAMATSLERRVSITILWFGTTSMLIAIMGLLAAVVQVSASRRSEFAVRLAVGARGIDLVRMLLREFAAPLLSGSAIGAFCHLWVMNATERVASVSLPELRVFSVSITILGLLGAAAAVIALPVLRLGRGSIRGNWLPRQLTEPLVG
jgi:hypothetical protein